LQRANPQFAMVRNNRRSRIVRSRKLHDSMASALADLREPVTLKNLADFSP
jgi:hypothetical protein